MSDDGFHEIQLNGKQLVFLFMAATVVSVVIFLCGVMVGRGVRSQQTPATEMAAAGVADVTPAEAPAPEPPPAPAPAAGTPEPVDDYYRDLTAEQPTDMKAKPAETRPAETRRTSRPEPARAAAATPPSAAPQPAAADAQPPSAVTSGGYAVQLVALSDRAEAENIVKRLIGKGYPAYIVNPVAGKPRIYRVQVGRYPERREADRIAARLRAEEQFSPWVTR
ncbi:MAG TPA: SPOR domain-containing protein [Vicinamibacterales bacterium]